MNTRISSGKMVLIRNALTAAAVGFAVMGQHRAIAENTPCVNCATQGRAAESSEQFPLNRSDIHLGTFTLQLDASLRNSFGTGSSHEKQILGDRGSLLFRGYLNVYRNVTLSPQGVDCSTITTSPAGLCEKARAVHDGTTVHHTWFGGPSDSNLSTLTYSPIHPVSLPAEDMPILRTYQRMMESGDFSSFLKIVRANPDQLNDQQFIELVSMIGSAMQNQYDHDRAENKNGRGDGIVSPDQILSASQNNLGNRVWWGENGVLPQHEAGVCRDIALAQAQILDARYGKGTSHVLAFTTVRGGHALVVTPDPAHPGKLLHLNYDRVVRSEGVDGSRALHLTQADFGDVTPVEYYVYDSDGRQVLTVPSELGKFTREAMGLELSAIDPLARKTSSLTRAGATLHSEQILPDYSLSAAVFTGATPSGHQSSGGTLRMDRASAPTHKTQIAVAFQQIERTPDPQENPNSEAMSGKQIDILLIQSNTPYQKKWDSKNLRLKLNTQFSSGYEQSRFTKDKTIDNFQAEGRVEIELQKGTRPDGRKQLGSYAELHLGTIFNAGISDVRLKNGNFDPRTVRLILNSAYIDAYFKKPLSLLSAAELRFILSGDALGVRGLIRGAYQRGNCEAGVTLSGRLVSFNESDPDGLLQESSLTRLGADAGCRIGELLHWNINLDTSLETQDGTRLTTGVGGNF